MAIRTFSSGDARSSEKGELLLASGAAMAMRMGRDEEPQIKAPHRSPYETLGYVIAGRAQLVIEGQTVELKPGDSWLLPADAEHSYHILEAFTAIECTSHPALAPSHATLTLPYATMGASPDAAVSARASEG